MTDTAWVHNLNPVLISFGDRFGIRWYGLAYLAGFIVGTQIILFLTRRGRGAIKPELVLDFVTYVVLGTMIGGRLGYALFYSTDLLTDFSTQAPFWGVLRVWEGGMASHGGIAGIFFASILFAKRHKLDFRHLGDLVVLGGSFGIFFGRLANFINGELFGREASPGFRWAVKFPGEMYLWLKHDLEKKLADPNAGPDLLPKMTEAVKSIGVSPDQWTSWVAQVRTSAAARSEIQVAIDRVIQAIEHGNEQVRVALGTFLTPRHPSQLYEAALEGVVTFVIVFWFWRKPRKAGVAGSLWLTVYALVRIIGEQWRMPDAHLGYGLLGLTRGQWLSVGMLVISVGLLVWCSRAPGPVISGWGKEARRMRDEEPIPPQGK
jgi:phosphatidylglycerol:prolipoprotein diacylglycerol transferase